MTFTKIKNGKYYFKGLDTWTNKEIEGHIINQPLDIELNRSWSVVFGLGNSHVDQPFFGKSLKSCKEWLTTP